MKYSRLISHHTYIISKERVKYPDIICPHVLRPIITSCLMKTTGASTIRTPSGLHLACCSWWLPGAFGALWGQGLQLLLMAVVVMAVKVPPPPPLDRTQNTKPQQAEVCGEPQWEHDPITGLCNWSEPRSALCNGIRWARCSQLGPRTTTVAVVHNNVGQITTLGTRLLFIEGLSVWRECQGAAGVSTSLQWMSSATCMSRLDFQRETGPTSDYWHNRSPR